MSSRARRALGYAALVAALLGGVTGIVQMGVHASLFAARLGFPLDLEWMEGGTLLHAYRLARGEPVYAPPSLDFIPFLYTPLYPAVVAALSRVAGLSYALGRLVSIASFAAAELLVVWLAWRQAAAGGRGARAAALAVGVAGAGVVASGYTFSGAFFDLVRGDSLLLALQAAAVTCGMAGRGKTSAAVAGVLIVLAFFTKQTASVVGVALGLGLLVTGWRRGVVYGLTAAALLAAGVGLMSLATDGWFWTYIFHLHQGHDFHARVVLVNAPLRMLLQAPPVYGTLVLATVVLAVTRRLERRDLILWLVAVGGFCAACIGLGTQWAFENAFVPGVYFPAFAAAVLTARLAALAVTGLATGRATAVASAAAVLAALALGVQSVRVGLPDRRVLVPRPQDHAAAARLLDRIRSLPGEVFVPFHPFYLVLAGKRPHLHRMGVLDVTRAGLGRPRGLDEAIRDQRFSHIILDWKSQSGEWPHLDAKYHPVLELRDGVDSVRSFSGADTSPRTLWAATRRRDRRAGETVLYDFESGAWTGWQVQGEAFGGTPAPASDGFFGRHAADSGRFGEVPTGTLRSTPFKVQKLRLRFLLHGPADPALRVLLLAGPETVHSATPHGGLRSVEWDLGALVGREVSLLIEDRSATGALAVDEVVAY